MKISVPANASDECRAWWKALEQDLIGVAAIDASGGTNVDVVSVVSEDRIRIRTWERGVEGETLACGSGAVAAAAAARARGGPQANVVVPKSGIPLRVEIPDPPGKAPYATLEGDARFVFEGTTGPEVLPAGDA